MTERFRLPMLPPLPPPSTTEEERAETLRHIREIGQKILASMTKEEIQNSWLMREK